jgi:sugar phosphate isomerase/epimerase
MRLCYDATRFGCGLEDAIYIAAQRKLAAVEFSFAPFAESMQVGTALEDREREYLNRVRELSVERSVAIASIDLDICLHVEDEAERENFVIMISKLAHVANVLACPKIAFFLSAGSDNSWKTSFEKLYARLEGILGEQNTGLLLRLATPTDSRGQSLKKWKAMEPQDWRDLLSVSPGLALSFSPADCVWLGIDYLRILPGIAAAVEHIEAHDIEINRTLLNDSGLYGPLWWRYRLPGKGQVDWPQFIEALKLYDFKGTFSIHLDDEFVSDQLEELELALDASIKKLAHLVKD